MIPRVQLHFAMAICFGAACPRLTGPSLRRVQVFSLLLSKYAQNLEINPGRVAGGERSIQSWISRACPLITANPYGFRQLPTSPQAIPAPLPVHRLTFLHKEDPEGNYHNRS